MSSGTEMVELTQSSHAYARESMKGSSRRAAEITFQSSSLSRNQPAAGVPTMPDQPCFSAIKATEGSL